MTSNQFFVDKLPENKALFFLEGREHHHLFRVVRIKPGDKVWLTDGRGRRLLAEVEEVEANRTRLRPLQSVQETIETQLILGLGLTRSETFEFLVQKATELGVTEIQPLLTRRSQPLPSDRLEKKHQRWEAIAREALKQCKGGILPHISYPLPLEEALLKNVRGLKFYLDEVSQQYFRDILLGSRAGEVYLLAGPEGGWEKEEKEQMERAGFKGLSLVNRVLRTETAVLAALSLISHFWNW